MSPEIEAALDMAEILRRRAEAIELGHTLEADNDQAPDHLAERAKLYVCLARDAATAGDRQDLDVAYRRLAKAGALILATMRRVRAEQMQ